MKKVKFTTMIDETLLEKIKIIAIKDKKSVSDILNALIAEHIKNRGEV